MPISAEHYATEALRMFQAGQIDPCPVKARKLLDWLKSSWEEQPVSLPDVYQLGPNLIRDAKTSRDAVRVLEDHGWP